MSAYRKAKTSKKELKSLAKKDLEIKTAPQKPIEIKEKIKVQVEVGPVISVSDFAKKMEIPVTDLIKALIKNGVMATINENIDFDTAAIVADELGFEVIEEKEKKTEKSLIKQETKKGKSKVRPPIVTIMGHVDHGKTSILDYIRKTHVTEGESGGITQHITAYQAEKKDRIITFIDTPGHEAFTKMRAHGAQITDIVVLVIAADDGVKPQTIEAIDHSKASNVPIIVAINKIDSPGADPEKVKRELSDFGLLPEEWGGDTIMVPVSAKTGEGIDELLDMIILVSDLKNFQSFPDEAASSIVIESKIEKGKGATATILIQDGTLRINDAVVIGSSYGKIRTMEDYASRKIKSAAPSMPVRISGISEVAEVGESMIVVRDLKQAKEIADQNYIKKTAHGLRDESRIIMRDLTEKVASGEIQELKLIIKSDVKGSLDAILKVISDIKTEKVSVNIIKTGTGNITESDIMLAKTSNALIFGFRIKIDNLLKKIAENSKVLVRNYEIIYELVDDLRQILKGMLSPEIVEIEVGKAKVVQIFRNDNKMKVAGCNVLEGKIPKASDIKIKREGEIISTLKISSLRRGKEEVKEAISGSECGISLAAGSDVEIGDIIIAFRTEQKESTL